MATIKDVAKLAGVAISTASNAINGKTGVKQETRQRVLEVAKQLNYVPNPIAQGLVTKVTKSISVIVSGPTSFNVFNNPVFFEIIKSIAKNLNTYGYQTNLEVISTDKEGEEIPRVAQSRSTDAMIIVGSRRNDQSLAQLLDGIKIPVLVVIRSAPSEKVVAVSSNNWKCGFMATQYLIDMGHRDISFIGALPGVSIAEERLAGYRFALREAGIEYDESFVIAGDFYQKSGLIAVRELIKKTSRMPTAIFAANDLMALGALEGLEQEGIRVPEEVSIIGNDNIPNLHLLKVPLTTVATPFLKIGEFAAKKVIGILEDNDHLPTQIILDSELKVRDSVRKIKDSF